MTFWKDVFEDFSNNVDVQCTLQTSQISSHPDLALSGLNYLDFLIFFCMMYPTSRAIEKHFVPYSHSPTRPFYSHINRENRVKESI